MFTGFNRTTRRRAYVILALLPTLLFRGVIPVGYMFSAASSGAPAIVLCPGVAPVPAQLVDHSEHATYGEHAHHHDPAGHDHGSTSHSGHEHSQSPCPFAAALSAAVAPPAVHFGLVAPSRAAEISAVAHEAPARFPLLRAQSPRAPPSLI
jgi:hypothetical protein